MSRLQDAAKQIALLRRISGKEGVSFGKPPAPRAPVAQEVIYVRYLRVITNALKIQTERILSEYLAVIKEGYENDTRRDNWSDDLEDFRVSLLRSYDNVLTAAKLEQKLVEISGNIDGFNLKEFQKMSRAVFGVPVVMLEPWKSGVVNSWVNENVSYIKNISQETANEIYGIVQRGVKEGARVTHIKNRVLSSLELNEKNSGQNITSISSIRKLRNRATLIAVDQTGKLNGQLTENRQKDIGVIGYKWRNVGDERVRGNPVGPYRNAKHDHWNREGKRFLWSDPPTDGHPGIPIRCRCGAEADLEELLNEIMAIEKNKGEN